jgi:hypothetical protein
MLTDFTIITNHKLGNIFQMETIPVSEVEIVIIIKYLKPKDPA